MSSTRLSLYLSFSLLVVTLLFACKKDSPVGSSLIANDNKFYGTLVDTLTVDARTVVDTVLPSENLSRVLVGELNDAEFGITKAQWFAQFLMPFNLSLGTTPTIDSVVLSFYVDSIYGLATSTTFRVYELTNSFASTTYYTNQSVSYGAELGNSTVSLTNDTGVVRVKLANNFGQKLLNATGDTLTNNAVFLQLLKGLTIRGEQNTLNPDQGAVYVVNPSHTSTKLSIYYTNPPALDQHITELKITSASRYFNRITHDFSGTTDLKNQLNDPSLGKNRLFVKPLAGTHVELNFPTISNWYKNNHYFIQRAELVLPLEANSYNTYRSTWAMTLVQLVNGTQTTMKDATNFGNYNIPSLSVGSYENRNGGRLEGDKFRFLITKFVNEQASNSSNDTLVLNALGYSVTPYRTIFAGTNQSNPSHVKLLVYYTK